MRLTAIAIMVGLAACSSDGGSHPYESQCTTSCMPDGVCAGMDAMPCVDECEAATDTVSSACAQCILDDTSWRETVGTGGTSCAGYAVGSASSSSCAASCQM
jgi:hypothetical protein